MRSKGMKLGGILAVVLVLTPLLAVAQVQYRESRLARNYDQTRGPIQVVNDWRDVVNVSMWSESRERIGEWVVRPGEARSASSRTARGMSTSGMCGKRHMSGLGPMTHGEEKSTPATGL